MPRIHSITSRQLLKRAWLPALLLALVTQTLAAGLDWSPYPEDKDKGKDAQKAKAAEVRARAAEQRAAELEQRLKAAEEKAAKAVPPVTPSMAAAAAPDVLAPLSVFRDKLKAGVEGPAMVVIPAGEFDMGSKSVYSQEQPVHRVTIKHSFAIGRTEVTQKEWRQVMGNNPPELSFKGCSDCPVESVSWDDVQAFIRKLSAISGRQYRLPSESEWEYACRGGKVDETYCGSNDISSVGWYRYITEGPRKAARLQPNAWGLYDMTGNVGEWVEDDHHDSYQNAPADGSAWIDRERIGNRVIRGGSWLDKPIEARSTSRENKEKTFRYGLYGFRLARTLP